MKEATGELNMTLVVVVIIAALLAFFYGTFWRQIRAGLGRTANCNNAVCHKEFFDPNTGTVPCNSEGSTREFSCPWKG